MFNITVEHYYVAFHFADVRHALEFAKLNKETKCYEEMLGEIRG
jgi:hypothetical protein